MSYEINVALKGTHLFATHPRSIVSSMQLMRVMEVFRKKFTKKEGYDVTVQYDPQSSYSVTVDLKNKRVINSYDELNK
jgi:hypothetical protein